jgi:precorrin-6B C5,15-methyltransferase / cobalt-precorrin-6B C5,C15-methyltransferase
MNWDLPDEAFSTTGGLLTRRELRLLCLAELDLQPGAVLWDIGAGSGAVSIVAARRQPAAQVFAIERRAELCDHIAENLRRFPTPQVHLVAGSAPAACAALPDPHAVFVGGSGGELAAIIELARARLQPGGRLVLTLVTLENLLRARACLPAARVVQIQVSVGVPVQNMLRMAAQNPVFVMSWKRQEL